MTLVVAGADGEQAWMVADTAITDPAVGVRDRLRDLKIETMHGTSMVGFADNPDHARRVIGSARLAPAGLEALEKLVSGRKAYPRIELAYAYWDGHQTHLHKMKTTNGKAEMVTTAWLGSKSAFDRLQQAKLEQQKDHSPNALHFLHVGGKSTRQAPTLLFQSIKAMLQSFAASNDREVGGFPVPYVVNRDGVFMVEYMYEVTDPIVDKLRPGSLIPGGTAQGGGFSFSLTELGDGEGVVAYWRQKPGGLVLIRGPQGVIEERFDGRPADFTERVHQKVGHRVSVPFSDQPIEKPDLIHAMVDEEGRPRVQIEGQGGVFRRRWVQSSDDSWRSPAQNVDLKGHRKG